MKKLSANVCAITHAGRVRRENEDNYSLNGRLTSDGALKKGSAYVQKMSEPFHVAVCDGMGGESYGELASGIAVEAIAKHAANIYESGEDFSYAVTNCADEANRKICAEIQARGVRMGTTFASVYAVKGKVICAGMGDTRIYHFSNGILEQVSFDHTHAQTIVDSGEVAQADIGTIPDAKRLTKHLGVFPEEADLTPNISVIDDVDNGDIILLCSDGLTDMLSDDEISAVVSGGENAQDVTGKLVRKALEKGGKDNITVVTAFIEAEDTAIFVPIAEAIVGDKDPSYEEEYRNSFGAGAMDVNSSPYANADADAYKKGVDKMKIIKIAAIALVALIVLGVAALIIKAAMGKGKEDDASSTSSTSLSDYYYYYNSTTESTTWFSETETTTESSTEESSTTESTTTTTTKKKTTTSTTKYRPISSTKPKSTNPPTSKTTTTKKPTSSSTQKPSESSTEKPSESSSTSQTNPTEPSATNPSTEPSSSGEITAKQEEL